MPVPRRARAGARVRGREPVLRIAVNAAAKREGSPMSPKPSAQSSRSSGSRRNGSASGTRGSTPTRCGRFRCSPRALRQRRRGLHRVVGMGLHEPLPHRIGCLAGAASSSCTCSPTSSVSGGIGSTSRGRPRTSVHSHCVVSDRLHVLTHRRDAAGTDGEEESRETVTKAACAYLRPSAAAACLSPGLHRRRGTRTRLAPVVSASGVPGTDFAEPASQRLRPPAPDARERHREPTRPRAGT